MTAAPGGAAPPARASRDRLGTALWAATLIWIAGMATVFPIGNEALEAVSIFTYDRIAFLVVAALFAAALARHPAALRHCGRVEAAMAVYLAVVAASWAMHAGHKGADDVKRDVDLLLTGFLMPYLAFLVARHGGGTRWQVRTACWVIVVAVGVFQTAAGLVQGLVDWRFLVAEVNQSYHRSRARGTMPNAVPYSIILALLMTIGLALRAHEARPPLRLLLVVLIVGLVEAVLLGQTRIVWIALPVALVSLAAASPPARRSAALACAGVIAVVALAAGGLDLRWLASADGALLQRHGSVGERVIDAAPIYNRVAVYATDLNMIVHQPLLGFGFGARTFLESRGDYYTSCCGVSPKWAVVCAVPHNEVLNVLVLMGVVGLLAYLGLLRELWRLLSAARTAAADPFAATLAAAAQAGLIALLVSALLHDVMYMPPAVQVIVFFLAGLGAPPARAAASGAQR